MKIKIKLPSYTYMNRIYIYPYYKSYIHCKHTCFPVSSVTKIHNIFTIIRVKKKNYSYLKQIPFYEYL